MARGQSRINAIELEKSITETQAAIDSFTADSMRADKFIELTKRYKNFTELTTPMINEFIEKIIVYEAEKVDGERFQEVDIYLNFIGKFEMLPQELTEEEERQQEKLKRRRESQRRYNAKKEKSKNNKKRRRNRKNSRPNPKPPNMKKAHNRIIINRMGGLLKSEPPFCVQNK